MFGKTPITALQEYCAKKTVSRPLYEFVEAADGSKSFVCMVQALGEMADGVGRSKKEAKHDASANIIKKLKITHPDIEDIPQAPHEAIPTSDAIADLRDFCLQQDHPLPFFDIVQQAGPPEAPEFTAECRVATIRRYATSSTKKGAKQLAAHEILRILRSICAEENKSENAVATINQQMDDEEEGNKKAIKTYRECVESDIKVTSGIRLCDRHNYFRNLDSDIRRNAFKVVNDSSIISDREKVHLLLGELKIKYKVDHMPALIWESMVFIELISDFDVVFAGTEDSIYPHMLEYFCDML